MLPNSKKKNNSEKAWKYLEDRFGVVREDTDFSIRKVNGDFWASTYSDINPDFSFETQGIRFVRDMKIGLKPTTYAIQSLDKLIEKNRVDLSDDELKALLDREMIERKMEEKGYVALFYKDRALGCGFYKDNLISSRIPKGRSKELKAGLNLNL